MLKVNIRCVCSLLLHKISISCNSIYGSTFSSLSHICPWFLCRCGKLISSQVLLKICWKLTYCFMYCERIRATSKSFDVQATRASPHLESAVPDLKDGKGLGTLQPCMLCGYSIAFNPSLLVCFPNSNRASEAMMHVVCVYCSWSGPQTRYL